MYWNNKKIKIKEISKRKQRNISKLNKNKNKTPNLYYICFYLLLFASICLFSLLCKKIKKLFSEVLVLYHLYKHKRNKKNYPYDPVRMQENEQDYPIRMQEKRARPPHMNAREKKQMDHLQEY